MKKTILCIDDIQTNLFIIQSVIEDMASDLYDIVLVDSANKGLAVLLKQKVDLVLMDIMMPDIDGLEATQMIKSNRKTKDIPVIFVTAKNDDATINKCYSVGGDDYVSKPFNHVELLARISFHLKSKENDKLLLKEKEYVQNILDLQDNLILVTSAEENIRANKAFLNFFDQRNLRGFKKEYESVCELFIRAEGYFSLNDVPDDSTWMDEIIQRSKNEDVLVKLEKDDNEYIFNIKVVSFSMEYIISFTDITYVSQLALEYKHEANYDSLTQIYNRNMFHRLIDRKISLSRSENSSFIFMLFDIDFFKKVNDDYGHLVGDEILISITKLIKKHIRDQDIFARWGGEEFVLSFDVSRSKGLEIANGLRKSIESYNFDSIDFLTCSFGITDFQKGDTLVSMIKRADDALYEAKDSGRNKVCEKY